MKKNNTETTSLRLITHEPLNQQDYFFMPAAQFKITTIGLRLFSSTDELTKKRCPSAVTSYRFGDVKFVTRVWNSAFEVPISNVVPSFTSTAIIFLSGDMK